MLAAVFGFVLGLAQAEPKEIKIWHAYRGAERTALEESLQIFDESREDLQISPLALPYDSFVSKIEAAAPRGNGPDLFIGAHERVGAWAESGLIREVASPGEDLHPVTVEAFKYQDKTWGYPMAFKCLSLFVNMDLLKKPPADTKELIQISDELLKKGLVPLAYESTAPYYHALWMHGFNGGLFNAAGEAKLNSPENIQSLEFVLKMQGAGLIPEEPTSALISQLFNEGKAAMAINGPWFLGELKENLNYRIFPLPLVSETGETAKPFLTVEGAMISAYSKNPEEAREIAVHLAGKNSSILRARKGRQSVANLSAYEEKDLGSDPILGAFREQLNQSVPMPNLPKMAATWEPMARAVRRVSRGAMTPEIALNNAQTEFDIVTRPPPPRVNPLPYLLLFGGVFLGLFGWMALKIRKNWEEIKKHKAAYMYVAPAAIAMFALSAVPFIVGAGVSLFSHNNGEFTFVGLSNFADIVFARDWPVTSSLSFYFTLAVTIMWTLSNVILHVGIGIGLAMLLREPWLKMRGFYRVLFILPWAVPNYITALIWKGMFHRQFGAINALLEQMGLEPVSWFSQFSTAFCANLITNTWLGFPFMMVVTLGALQSIPRDLEHAASVDGASGWQRFRHITLPLLKPALMPAVVLGSVWTFNMFNIIYLVSGGEPDSATDILISDAYRWAFTRGHRYGYAAAYAVLIFFILLAYSKLGNKIAGRKTI